MSFQIASDSLNKVQKVECHIKGFIIHVYLKCLGEKSGDVCGWNPLH